MNVEPYANDVPLAGADAPRADQIETLIKLLVTIRHRFGNTAVRYSLQWGACALWARDDQAERIGELEDLMESLAPGFKRKMPRRCYELKLRVGGDTWPDVAQELERLADNVQRGGPMSKSVTGGESVGSIVLIRHDPEMSHDKYFEELTRYQAGDAGGADEVSTQ